MNIDVHWHLLDLCFLEVADDQVYWESVLVLTPYLLKLLLQNLIDDLILALHCFFLLIIINRFAYMITKIVQKEIVNILTSYLYSKPLEGQNFGQDQGLAQEGEIANIHKPLDVYLRSSLNARKYLQNSQKSIIKDKIYNLARYEYLLSHLTATKPYDIELISQPPSHSQILQKIDLLFSPQFRKAADDVQLPKSIRSSQNPLLFKQLITSLDPNRNFQLHCSQNTAINDSFAYQVSCFMNTASPLSIRVNPLKIGKYQLMQRLKSLQKLKVQQCQYAPFGLKIVAAKGINILETTQFLKGHFQIQDEGSQLVATSISCKPGDLILDYCGGANGSSLAIAHLLDQKGQIFILEPREVAMGKIKRRFIRAGVTNVQYHRSEESLNRIALGKMNWVIVDAPSTCTGVIRRNPDIKLKFTHNFLQSKVELQRKMVGKALKFMHRNGRLVYITQSLLKQQNDDQISQLCRLYGLQIQKDELMRIIPQKDGMDGYFAAVLKKIG